METGMIQMEGRTGTNPEDGEAQVRKREAEDPGREGKEGAEEWS